MKSSRSPSSASTIIIVLFCILFAIAIMVPESESTKSISIASFNIQVFGSTKISHPEVKEVLVQTLKRFSVIFIQEIRDASQTAIFELLDALNENITTTQFKMVLSTREGRSVSKEQYAYIFRPDHVELIDVVQYNDKQDWFERPPYGMKVKTRFGQTLMLLGIHISPGTAVSEIDHLVDVYHDLHQPWIGPSDNVIFMGDFNAGCRFVSHSKWPKIRLRNETSTFDWLIKDDQITTTVGGGDCPYDRFVIGQGIKEMTKPIASVFNYTQEFDLSADFSRKVSDHYPIFMKIYEPEWYRDDESPEIPSIPPPLTDPLIHREHFDAVDTEIIPVG